MSADPARSPMPAASAGIRLTDPADVTASIRDDAAAVPASATAAATAALFAGPGDVRARARATRWAATPLGPVDRWSPALRSAVRLILESPVAMSLWCGPSYTLLYNDAYRSVLGANHPAALGQPGAERFAELWAELEPQFAGVRAGGPAVSLSSVSFRLQRRDDGGVEDAWFDYALSAVRDPGEPRVAEAAGDDGDGRAPSDVVAVLAVVTETTARMRVESALTAERERLRSLILQMPGPIALHAGPEHRYELVNEAYRRISGGGRDVTGLAVRDAFPEAAGQGLFETIDRVYATGEPFAMPELLVRYDRDGTGPADHWFNLRLEPVRDRDGAVTAIINFSFDVTDQVRARREVEAVNAQLQDQTVELELQAEELQATTAHLEELTQNAQHAQALAEAERARAEAILESMADAYFALDSSYHITAVNAAMERGSGFTRDELVGRLFWDLFPGALNTAFERHFRAAVTERVEAHFEHDYSDGRLDLVVEEDVYPADGDGIAVFWRDITARVKADAERRRLLVESEAKREALTASETRYRTLAEAVPVQVWTARANGDLDFASERTAAYFGVPAAQVLGEGWSSVVHPDDLPEAGARWADALASGTPYETEFRLRAANGEYRWHLTRALPVRDAATGAVTSWVGSNTDVEDERCALAEAEAARHTAESANRAKSEFLAIMSHELRTPLNAIGGYAELMELGIRGPITDEQRLDLGRIRKSQQHLLGLINGVLNYSRVEAGAARYDLADVPLDETLATCEALTAPQRRSKGLSFRFDGCDPALRVRADAEKLQQIVLNLLTNAMKFTATGGRVELACMVDGARVRVVVRDTGQGIAPGQLERVFEPFVQVDAKLTRTQEGVGLGLAISRDLARGMGCELTAESEPGVGSTFTLTLPVVLAAAAGGDGPTPAA